MILKNPKTPLFFGIAVIVGLVAYVTLYRSSPGDLSRPHGAVAGSSFISDCNKCHAQKDVTVGCLSCHQEIQAQLDKKTGFHPFLLKDKKLECARCHSEHNGADFALVSKASWEGKNPKEFNHPHVDFRLKGAHSTLACEKCHTAKNHTPYFLPKFEKQVRADTFLGLSQACVTCHADPHAGGRVTECASCHSQERWKPAPNFNHEKFFPLKGAHSRVSCSQCHAVNRKPVSAGGSLKIFGPVKGTRCLDCHDSPHKTNWQRSCEACHKVDTPWSSASARFTKELHALTGYKLMAPHDKVSCEKCHAPGRSFAQRYPVPARAANRCEICHQDPHRGQFTAKHPHCVDCHGSRAFTPSTFSVKDHQIYPLIGGHAKASCNACHTKEKRTGMRQFINTPRICASCHRDIHYGQFRDANGTKCENCHTSPAAWSRLVFNHNRQSRFKLDEAHAKVACKVCHPTVSLSNGVTLVQFKPIKSQCSDCHGIDQLENR